MKRHVSEHISAIVVMVIAFTTARSRADPPPTVPAGETVTVPATVEAFWSADLNAKTSGYVSAVRADLGDHVKKDQLLAEIRVPELEKSLAAAMATLEARRQMLRAAEAAVAQSRKALEVAQKQSGSYEADLKLQEVTLKRQEELSAGHAATAQQLDDAKAKAEVARAIADMGNTKVASAGVDIEAAEANHDVAAAQVAVAEAQVGEARALLDYTKITAPFDGIITRRTINPGDLVQSMTASRTMPLFTVQQIDTMRVFCDVPELKAAAVHVDGDADIKVYGLDGKVLTGHVTRIAGALDAGTRTMRVEIDMPNPNETLRPGMYAQVTLKLGPPAKAIGPAVVK
jgi:multidrug efflux pump subunit AcrA (membrane-fusion protein)